MTGKTLTTLRGPTTVEADLHARATDLPGHSRTAAQQRTMELHWIETLDDLLALRSDWQRLENAAASPQNFFQSFTWCSVWASVYLDGTGNIALKTLVARANGAVAMIWPLMVVRHGAVTILKWLSDPIGQYGDVLIDEGIDQETWLAGAWSQITQDPDIDGIALRNVRADARICTFLSDKCQVLPEQKRAPQLNLKPFKTADDYSMALSRNQRSQRSKLRKRLERDGPVEFDVHCGTDSFRTAVTQALDYKRRWLKERSLKADVIGNPLFEEVIVRIGKADPSAIAAGVLSRNDDPLCVDIAFTYKGRYYGSVIAENPAVAAQSPTKVHLDLRQKHCVDAGFSEFDMMVPDSAFKQHWSDSTVAALDYIVPMNLWGLLYCSVYLARVRPFVKRVYYAVGEKPRAVIIGTLIKLRILK